MNLWIIIDITIFTCFKLADLANPGLYLVVETDGWHLHNDASEKPLLFNEVYKNFPWRIGAVLGQISTATVSAAYFSHLTPHWKVAFLIVKMTKTCLWPVSTQKTNRQSQISVIETVLGGKISDYSLTLWRLFHMIMLAWCYTILNSMYIVPIPLSNNIEIW